MTRQGPELEARTSSKCAELACLACYIPDRHCSTLCIPIDLSSIYLHLFRGAWAPNRAPNPGPEPKLRTNRATTLNLNLNHVCYISKAYFARLPMSWRLGSPSRPRIRGPNLRTSGDYTQLEFEPCLLHLWGIVCKAARTIYPFHGDWAPHPGVFEHQATTLNLNLNHACYISKA